MNISVDMDTEIVPMAIGIEFVSGNEQELLLETNKEYHLFFSYSSQDESLIIPILEILESAPYNLKCCIDRRDFMLGETTVDNIYHALNHSMGTVFFLTPRFMESEYCNHEKQTAFTMYMEGECRVIPVILKPCLVPDEFRNIHYIDESMPEVIADTIFKCLKVDPKDFKKKLPLNPIQAGQSRINGNRIMLPIDQLLQNLNKNGDNATESLLTSHQQSEIQKIGIQVCDSLTSLLNMVIYIAVNKPHYANRNRYFVISLFLKIFISINSIVLMHSLIDYNNNILTNGATETLLMIVVVIVFLAMYIDRCQSTNRPGINKINKLSVLDKQCCFKLCSLIYGSPGIWVIKYDITSCKNFLEEICTQYYENEDASMNFEEIWNDTIESKLFKAYFQKLVDGRLPHTDEERHIVVGKKLCFCQYLDQHSGKFLKLVSHRIAIITANNSNSDEILLVR